MIKTINAHIAIQNSVQDGWSGLRPRPLWWWDKCTVTPIMQFKKKKAPASTSTQRNDIIWLSAHVLQLAAHRSVVPEVLGSNPGMGIEFFLFYTLGMIHISLCKVLLNSKMKLTFSIFYHKTLNNVSIQVHFYTTLFKNCLKMLYLLYRSCYNNQWSMVHRFVPIYDHPPWQTHERTGFNNKCWRFTCNKSS